MSEELEPGTTVADRYRVERLLGEGGMGAVYEAMNLLTEKRVALKWIQGEAAKDDNASRRLLREAKLAARIEHPHVVDIYDVGNDGDSVFLVMELLRGETLSEMFTRRGVVPHEELLGLLMPVLHALTSVHAQNIIHRDLKPSNIFLCEVAGREAPVPKLLDFGIARDTEGNTHLTGTGQVVGTPAYMAAEQIDGGLVDERTDVYAMGVILYEGLVGRRPYVGNTVFQVVSKIMEGAPPRPPHEVDSRIPETLSRIVLRAIEKARDRRYASAAELVRDLGPFAPTSSKTSSSMYPTMVPAAPVSRVRGGALWILLAVLAATGVVVVAVYPLLISEDPEPEPPDLVLEPGPSAPTPEPATVARPQPPEEPPIEEPPNDPGPEGAPVEMEPEVDPPAPTKARRRRDRPDVERPAEGGRSRFGLEPTQF